MINRSSIAVLLCCLLPIGTAIAVPVTYSYTGKATNVSGASNVVSIGDTVSGSFTVDFSYGNSWQSSGVPGSVTPWSVNAYGSAPNLPRGLIFSLSAHVDSVIYNSGPLGPYSGNSDVRPVGGNLAWVGEEGQDINLTDRNQSIIYLYHMAGFLPFLSDGLPNLPEIDFRLSYGQFATRVNNQMQEVVAFSFDSIQRVDQSTVPEPGSLVLLGLGLAGLGASRRRQNS